MQYDMTPSQVSSANQKMADMNKRILLHSSLQLYLSPDTPISFVIERMQNFINIKSETSGEGLGGKGNGSWNASSPSPLPLSRMHSRS